jgi:hypothetical protein
MTLQPPVNTANRHFLSSTDGIIVGGVVEYSVEAVPTTSRYRVWVSLTLSASV